MTNEELINYFDKPISLHGRDLFRQEFQMVKMATGKWYMDFAGAYFLDKMVVTIIIERQEADYFNEILTAIKDKLMNIPKETLNNPPIFR